MTYKMKTSDQSEQVASIELAGALLRAWVRGDRPALEAELDRSSRIAPELLDTGEMERLQMLGAIAARMKASTDPLSPDSEDLGVHVCVNLLSHLACPTIPEESHRTGWGEPRPVRRSAAPSYFRSAPVRLGTLTLH